MRNAEAEQVLDYPESQALRGATSRVQIGIEKMCALGYGSQLKRGGFPWEGNQISDA